MATRSRVFTAVAAVLAPAVFIAQLVGGTPAALASLAAGLMVLGFLFGMALTAVRMSDLSRRPARFFVSPKGFHTRPATPPGVLILLFSVGGANLLGGMLARARTDSVYGILAGVNGVLLAAAAVAAVFVVGRAFVDLTPEGIGWGRWLFRRQVGWDDLAPGSPALPHPGDSNLKLDTRDGRKTFSALVDVNPRFLTHAIRWYVRHPEHRAGIGTQTEHDRLVRELQVPA